MNNTKPLIGILMGSDSDWPMLQDTCKTLDVFGIPYEVRVLSAHRTPDLASDYSKRASRRGIKVIIAAAGGAAHLAGVIAAHTVLPVIGIPIRSGALNGVDSLLATIQMPAGIPVATVTLGSAGAVNAAILAVQILATDRPVLTKKLVEYKAALKGKVISGNAKVQSELHKK